MTDQSSKYTILYALMRALRFGDGPPQHECYHHLARVTAPSLERAIARCRRDAIGGFNFQLLITTVGDLELLAVGTSILVHTFAEGDDP